MTERRNFLSGEKMSVFQVNLHNFNANSPIDVGLTVATPAPRTMYAPGPDLINRVLKDGATFTDNNYWKQFAYPQVPLANAFINVLSDDGSVYQAGQVSTTPVVYNLTIAAGSTYSTTGNFAPILATTNSVASFAQITNNGTSGSVNVRLNGLTTAVFTLAHGSSQVFNAGDLEISLIEIDNSASGSVATSVQIIAAVNSVSQS